MKSGGIVDMVRVGVREVVVHGRVVEGMLRRRAISPAGVPEVVTTAIASAEVTKADPQNDATHGTDVHTTGSDPRGEIWSFPE